MDFYDANAADFIAGTLHVDMSPLYERFLPLVPVGGRILDAGCGSGRDSQAFLSRGFQVISFDKSWAMVEATTYLTGRKALQLAFEELKFNAEFDAVWACASLLHVGKKELPSVLTRILKATKPGGIVYMSFKYGDSERTKDSRLFNDYNEISISPLVEGADRLPESIWLTDDARRDRDEKWLNVIVRRLNAQDTP